MIDAIHHVKTSHDKRISRLESIMFGIAGGMLAITVFVAVIGG